MRTIYRVGLTLLGYVLTGSAGTLLVATTLAVKAVPQQNQNLSAIWLLMIPTIAGYALLRSTISHLENGCAKHPFERDFICGLIGGSLLYAPVFILTQGWALFAYGMAPVAIPPRVVQLVALIMLAVGAGIAVRLWRLADAADARAMPPRENCADGSGSGSVGQA